MVTAANAERFAINQAADGTDEDFVQSEGIPA